MSRLSRVIKRNKDITINQESTSSLVDSGLRIVLEIDKTSKHLSKLNRTLEEINNLVLLEEAIKNPNVGLIQTSLGEVRLSKPRKKTVIKDKRRALELLSNIDEGLVLDLISLPIRDLKKYLTQDELDTCIEIIEGERSLKWLGRANES